MRGGGSQTFIFSSLAMGVVGEWGGERGGGGRRLSFPSRAAVAAGCQTPPVSQRTKRRG